MPYLLESFLTALDLIMRLDRAVFFTAWTSLYTATTAALLSSLVAIPAGIAIGLGRFRGRRSLITLLNTLMSLPTVVIGLVLFGLLSRQGPLGEYGLLFTPWAVILGQMVLALPLMTHYSMSAANGADPRIVPLVQTLGASRWQTAVQLAREIRFGIMAALIAGFGRVIAEVGIAMMLGGNIRDYTRTMTTAIALETSKGEFAFGLALGMILLGISFVVNILLSLLQRR